jgi:CheY-like chemotaxis protein
MVPRVIIADADLELSDLYRAYFSRQGWRVETSCGGFECLEQLRLCRPHVLILGSPLPWGGADGLLAVMRNDEELRDIPVIVTTASAWGDLPSELGAPPVVRVVLKPCSLQALHELALAHAAKEAPAYRPPDQALRGSHE